MASISTDNKGLRRIQFVNGNGERKSIRLGRLPMKRAIEIKLRVEALNAAKAGNFSVERETAAWVAGVGDDIYCKLAAVGLLLAREKSKPTTLGAFVSDYIESRTDVKPRTRINLERAERWLNGFFGEDRNLE